MAFIAVLFVAFCVHAVNAIPVSTESSPTSAKPSIARSGICPAWPTPVKCPPRSIKECENDRSCKELYHGNDLKCCQAGCHILCVPPFPSPNTSPNPTTQTDQRKTSPTLPSTSSPTTSQLPSNKKPSNDTGRHLYREPGVCPRYQLNLKCPPKIYRECRDDYDCSKRYPGRGSKCCRDNCDDNWCTIPQNKKCAIVYSTLHQCPAISMHECDTDESCGKLYPGRNLICCLHDGCSRGCVPLPNTSQT